MLHIHIIMRIRAARKPTQARKNTFTPNVSASACSSVYPAMCLQFSLQCALRSAGMCRVSYSPTRGGGFPQARIPLSSKLKLELPAMNVMQVLKSLIRTESSSSRDMVTICGPVWKSVPVSIHRVSCKF